MNTKIHKIIKYIFILQIFVNFKAPLYQHEPQTMNHDDQSPGLASISNIGLLIPAAQLHKFIR